MGICSVGCVGHPTHAPVLTQPQGGVRSEEDSPPIDRQYLSRMGPSRMFFERVHFQSLASCARSMSWQSRVECTCLAWDR